MTLELQGHHSPPPPPAQRPWLRLQVRMALSFVGVTVGVAIILEVLLLLLLSNLLTLGIGELQPVITNQIAQKYALLAADQGQGVALNPQATFLPGQPATLSLPDTTWQGGSVPYQPTLVRRPVMVALLITPGTGPSGSQEVLASSYPARYPNHTPVVKILPARAQIIHNALLGINSSGTYTTASTTIAYAVEPVWNWHTQPIGAVYVEIPLSTIAPNNIWKDFVPILLASAVVFMIAMIPVGALFGWLTTHVTVRRIQHLATATSRFAAGDDTQRVPVGHADEIGQLEEHFNRMAVQLTENITQRQNLASQNARLAERGRIARDLHDSIKQQVFAIGLQLGTALSLVERDPLAAAQHVRQADTLAYQTQRELTTLIHELRPLALQTQGFFAALRDAVAIWSQQTAIATEVHFSAPDVLAASVEDGLLRVAQEALANVARHSQAHDVQVTLVGTAEWVTLTLTDDGRGFTPVPPEGPVPMAGVGLSSMQERMQALGGSVTVQSAPGLGTRIVAQCPTQAKASASK